MILKDGSDVPVREMQKVMTELRGCSPGDRRLLRPGAYGREVPRAVLDAHPVLLYRGRLSAAATAVIMNAVLPDGKLTSPVRGMKPYEE